MKCDGCGKDIPDERELGLMLRIEDYPPGAERTLGKYYGTKVNMNGILTWVFCFECVLDKLLGQQK